MLGPIAALTGLMASPNSPSGGFNPLQATYPPIYSPFIHATFDITVAVKKVAENPAVLAS